MTYIEVMTDLREAGFTHVEDQETLIIYPVGRWEARIDGRRRAEYQTDNIWTADIWTKTGGWTVAAIALRSERALEVRKWRSRLRGRHEENYNHTIQSIFVDKDQRLRIMVNGNDPWEEQIDAIADLVGDCVTITEVPGRLHQFYVNMGEI